jgi:hypothetical protein
MTTEHNEAVEAMKLQGASASAIEEKELEAATQSIPVFGELKSELKKECAESDIMKAFLIGVVVHQDG